MKIKPDHLMAELIEKNFYIIDTPHIQLLSSSFAAINSKTLKL